VPLCLLYELGIFLARFVGSRSEADQAEAVAEKDGRP